MTGRPLTLAVALALTAAATACATDQENPTPTTTRATLAERAAVTTRPASSLPQRGDEPSMRILETEPWPERTDHEATGQADAGPFDTRLRFIWALRSLIPAPGTTPVLSGPQMIVATGNEIVGFERSTGQALWTMRFTAGTVTATPLALGSRIFTSTTAGHVVAFNALDGAVEMDVNLSGSGEKLTAPVLNGGLLYVASDHGRIWRINPDTDFVVPFDVGLTIDPTAQLVTNPLHLTSRDGIRGDSVRIWEGGWP